MFIRTPKELGALIRDRRKSLGLRQAALAERVGVSRQWNVEVEHGKPRTAVGLVFRTLEGLRVKLAVDGQKSQGPPAEVPDSTRSWYACESNDDRASFAVTFPLGVASMTAVSSALPPSEAQARALARYACQRQQRRLPSGSSSRPYNEDQPR